MSIINILRISTFLSVTFCLHMLSYCQAYYHYEAVSYDYVEEFDSFSTQAVKLNSFFFEEFGAREDLRPGVKKGFQIKYTDEKGDWVITLRTTSSTYDKAAYYIEGTCKVNKGNRTGEFYFHLPDWVIIEMRKLRGGYIDINTSAVLIIKTSNTLTYGPYHKKIVISWEVKSR